MTAAPSSRIAVFVSSTIGECAAERVAAKTAIEALNYECILFETIGARPHPARVTYLQGLARSQICVLIWKESYGYIDPETGLNISGIEDEYRRALDYGRDMLLYAKRDAPKRDPRLAALVEEAKPRLTISFYDDEASLGDQIKADITSIVSQNYIDKFPAHAARLIDPAAILGGIAPAQLPFIERPELEAALDASVPEHQNSWVVGPPGSGKTVLLAQWSRASQSGICQCPWSLSASAYGPHSNCACALSVGHHGHLHRGCDCAAPLRGSLDVAMAHRHRRSYGR